MNLQNALERDLGKRIQIWQYPLNHIDEVRMTYLKCGSYQMHLKIIRCLVKMIIHEDFSTHGLVFPSWLEYSPLKDVAYFLLFYLFSKKPSGRPDSDVFIVTAN